jgi:hypothetical protein
MVRMRRSLNQAPAILARASPPAYASALCDRCDMLITLRRHPVVVSWLEGVRTLIAT